jgi:hypothetical protein
VSREPFLLSGFAIAVTGFAIAILPKWRLTHNTLRDDAHRTLAIHETISWLPLPGRFVLSVQTTDEQKLNFFQKRLKQEKARNKRGEWIEKN